MFSFWLSSAKEWNSLTFKEVRCVLPPVFFYQNFSCFAKSMNRSCSTFTMIFESIRPINLAYVGIYVKRKTFIDKLFFKLEVHIYYKYGTIYRKVMYLPPVEWCHLAKFGTTNVLTKFIFDFTDQSAPGLVHHCPYKKVNVTRAQVNAASAKSAFASGDYKSSFIFKNEKQALLLSVNFVFSVNSSEKNSFGWWSDRPAKCCRFDYFTSCGTESFN